MKIGEALRLAAGRLKQQGFSDSYREAQLLMALVKSWSLPQLICCNQEELSSLEQEEYFAFLQRRLGGEPYAYISGYKAFLHWDFVVNSAVLIPRPETELLVEKAVQELGDVGQDLLLADIGVGSGIVGLSLLGYFPAARLHGVDISGEALAVARENAQRLGFSERAQFFQGDLLQPLATRRGQYQCICANLPYIPQGEYNELSPEVKREPITALTAGKDGLDCYRRLIPRLGEFLRPGGLVLLEIGHCQGAEVSRLFAAQGLQVQVQKDLAGLDRIVWARYY
jgi:release factor glutamine methyltransferase